MPANEVNQKQICWNKLDIVALASLVFFCTTFFSSTNGIAFSPLIGGSCIYARYHFCEDVKLFLQISLDDATKYHVYTVRLQ